MRLPLGPYLTYCTNIHPANGWQAVRASLERYSPRLKKQLCPDSPFGIGLRLSGVESQELLEGNQLARFKAYLDAEGLMVFTMNGFPHGPFHKQAVKDQVHAPDWRSAERVRYTQRLIQSLAYLLPEGMEGGISTSPLSYKPWLNDGPTKDTWTLLTRHMVEVAATLVQVERETGKLIHIDIEPEPDGLLETSTELVSFFTDWLLPVGGLRLAQAVGVSQAEAEELLLRYIRVCWDTCHVAVAFEEPAAVLKRYQAHGIQVGKIQISSALNVTLPQQSSERLAFAEALESFVESTYLHQVVQRDRDGSLTAFRDLDQALPYIQKPEAQQWRIHFHVPIFLERYGLFEATQPGILETFALLRDEPFTQHLEIETYTWDVLPDDLKRPLDQSILREFGWVRMCLGV